MSASSPTVYLLYGDDRLSFSESIEKLQSKLGDASISALNTNRFSATKLDLAEFATICLSAPFLAERRLVILDDANRLGSKKTSLNPLLGILSDLPASTAVVLLDHVDGNNARAESNYQRKSSLYKWIKENKNIGWSRACFIPKKGGFTLWVKQRCEALGGEIELAGAAQLSEHIHEDPLLADSELHKLLDYVDYQRPINPDDVILLTPYVGEADIFEMVDAIGLGNKELAIDQFHQLLEKKDVRLIFGMIIRQFRLLIEIRSVLDRKLDPVQHLDMKPFVLKKLSQQARNFSMSHLFRIYRELYDMDTAIKTSQTNPVIALDTFIVRNILHQKSNSAN